MVLWTKGDKWFGLNPPIVIAICVLILLLFLFLPLFSVKVDVKEIVMVNQTKEVPETVTENEIINVWVGCMAETKSSGGGGYYYNPVVIIPSFRYPYNNYEGGSSGNSNFQMSTDTTQTQTYSSNYYGGGYYPSYYGSTTTAKHTVDVSDEIVDLQKSRGPDNTWVLSLKNRNGNETIYRNVTDLDLTKTGQISAPVTKTKMKQVQEQVPKELTKQEIILVNLIQLIFKSY
jgi:hypothetical protein